MNFTRYISQDAISQFKEMLASLYCFTVQQLANICTLDSVVKVLQWNYCQ